MTLQLQHVFTGKGILTLPGLRIAKPGEFSERAFLNDKLDLAQAEAIADLIDASSEQAARSALNVQSRASRLFRAGVDQVCNRLGLRQVELVVEEGTFGELARLRNAQARQSQNTFTGEDVLELQGHGGPVILDLLLKRILTLPGLRIAKPGEFSERAFLNDKLDLARTFGELARLRNAQARQSQNTF